MYRREYGTSFVCLCRRRNAWTHVRRYGKAYGCGSADIRSRISSRCSAARPNGEGNYRRSSSFRSESGRRIDNSRQGAENWYICRLWRRKKHPARHVCQEYSCGYQCNCFDWRAWQGSAGVYRAGHG